MDWVQAYGKGRVYVTMLGHTWKNEEPDNPNLHCTGFQTLFLRGLEWAATGKVTVPMPADFPTAEKISVRRDEVRGGSDPAISRFVFPEACLTCVS